MAAPVTLMAVVVHDGNRRYDPTEVRVDLDDRDELRDTLIREARRLDSYRSGSASGGEWLDGWALELYEPSEARKGTYAGGWGTPEKVATFAR